MQVLKSKHAKPVPEFEPFDLVLTIENETELAVMYSIFNSIPISDFLLDELDEDVADQIRSRLGHNEGCNMTIFANLSERIIRTKI